MSCFESVAAGEKTREFFVLNLRVADRLAVVTRTAKPFSEPDDCERAFRELDEDLNGVDRVHHSLLVDLREVGGRNDGDFEKGIAPLRQALLQSFAHAALVVATFIGRLQVQRHLREDGSDSQVFVDIDEAIAALKALGGT